MAVSVPHIINISCYPPIFVMVGTVWMRNMICMLRIKKANFSQVTVTLWIITIVLLQIPVTIVTSQVSITIGTYLLGTNLTCRLCLKIQLNNIYYGYRTFSSGNSDFPLIMYCLWLSFSESLHIFFSSSYTHPFLCLVLQVIFILRPTFLYVQLHNFNLFSDERCFTVGVIMFKDTE